MIKGLKVRALAGPGYTLLPRQESQFLLLEYMGDLDREAAVDVFLLGIDRSGV